VADLVAEGLNLLLHVFAGRHGTIIGGG